jgi:gluconolactonase
VLAEGYEHPNDVVYAIDGSIYFSCPRPRGTPGDSAVYQVSRGGRVREVSKDCQRPNGVALSPNQQKLYVADSGARTVWVFDITADGSLKNGRVLGSLGSDLPGNPDGLKTDESGNVWVAGAGGIWVFHPEGKHLGTIPVPETPSNLNWGEGFRNLYITARTSVYRLETKVPGTRTY